MAGFWSMLGLMIKSLITGQEIVGDSDETDTDTEDAVLPDNGYPVVIARFGQATQALPDGQLPPDPVAELVANCLSAIPDSKPVLFNQHFTINPEIPDPFQAVREAQFGVLNAAHRSDAEVAFWGGQNPQTGHLEVRLISDELSSPLYDVLLPLIHSFAKIDHKDTAEALRILLSAETVMRSRGGDQRALQIARLSAHLETFQERIQEGEYFQTGGAGIATAYAFGAYILAETGDRSYCVSALKILEPHIRAILKNAGEKKVEPVKPQAPSGLLGEGIAAKTEVVKEARTEELVSAISDFSGIESGNTALLAMYGGLVNWSLIGNLKARSSGLAIGLWKLLERRFELSVGTPVDRAFAICKLGEAMVARARDTESAKLADSAATQFRRAIGMISSHTHGTLYAIAAYGLAEAIVASATIREIPIPDDQVIPVFQAALKVCARRERPYIWGRTMFALASVQLASGSHEEDKGMLAKARMGFSQSYEALLEAGAKGAARAAFGGYTRTENLISQIGHRKAATNGNGSGQISPS